MYMYVHYCDLTTFRVQVGYGSVVGQGEIMEHTRTTGHPDIQEMGLSTGWNSTGVFQLYNIEGTHSSNMDC